MLIFVYQSMVIHQKMKNCVIVKYGFLNMEAQQVLELGLAVLVEVLVLHLQTRGGTKGETVFNITCGNTNCMSNLLVSNVYT